jgi:hypothetical protein
MTRRSDKCDCCVYEYINRKTGGGDAAVHRNRQNKYRGVTPLYPRKGGKKAPLKYDGWIFFKILYTFI